MGSLLEGFSYGIDVLSGKIFTNVSQLFMEIKKFRFQLI